MKNILLVSFLALISVKGSSQGVSSISINAGPDKCASPTATLTATATQTGFPATTQYTVAPVTPYTNVGYDGTDAYIGISKIDDVWLDKVFDLGFSFSYFGNTYTKLIVGVNGEVTFDLAKQNKAEGYDYLSNMPGVINRYNSIPNNTICALNRDINPANGGTIYTKMIGTAPCRSFVISWVNIPLYGASCNGTPLQTFQLVLRESTNQIDVNIQTSTSCIQWGGGGIIGVQAIQNGISSVNCAVASRNAGAGFGTTWSASNESWRFSPNGTATTVPYTGTITWTGPNGVIGTGASINVTPVNGTIYTASISASNCSGTIYASDWAYVNKTPVPDFNLATDLTDPSFFTISVQPVDLTPVNNWDFNYCFRVEGWSANYASMLFKFDYCKNDAPSWNNYPGAEVFHGFDHIANPGYTGTKNGTNYTLPAAPLKGKFKNNYWYRIFRSTANNECGWREVYYDLRVVRPGMILNGEVLTESKVIISEMKYSSDLDATTGISNNMEASNNNVFIVFPNPSNGLFTIDLIDENKATMEVFDMTGRIIKTVQLNKNDHYTLDLSGYAKGQYMIKMNGAQQQLQKIILE
jgi:hypothetical protein